MAYVFVEVGDNYKEILNVSAKEHSIMDILAVAPEPIDFDKLAGYQLVRNMGNSWRLMFSQSLIDEKERKIRELEREQQERDALMEVMMETVLPAATDEQALKMVPLYPDWEVGKEYKAQKDRFKYGGKLYKAIVDHTARDTFPPDMEGTNLCVEVTAPDNKFPEYKQPTGAHNAYKIGDGITYNGKTYVCVIDNTVHNPDEYPDAWVEATDDVPEGYDLEEE